MAKEKLLKEKAVKASKRDEGTLEKTILIKSGEVLNILDEDSQTKKIIVSFEDGVIKVVRQHKELQYAWVND
jgi:hypothetical protein